MTGVEEVMAKLRDMNTRPAKMLLFLLETEDKDPNNVVAVAEELLALTLSLQFAAYKDQGIEYKK